MNTITITINGMNCEHCITKVQKALRSLDEHAQITVSKGTADMITTHVITDEHITATLDDFGYDVMHITRQ